MISKEIQNMINTQINAELWSAYLYLSMSICAESSGHNGISTWLYIQSCEEVNHSRILQNFMLGQGCKVKFCSIDEVPCHWSSPLDIMQSALKQEKNITKNINDIMQKAQAEKDYATSNLMSWFINEQSEEENTCQKIIQQYENASNTPCAIMQIDRELGTRKYQPLQFRQTENWYT